MSFTGDNPILNNPFEEPKEYWVNEKRSREGYQASRRRYIVIIKTRIDR